MIGKEILARVAQLLLRLGAARNALHSTIDNQIGGKRDRQLQLSGLAQKVFFDYPAILNEWHTNPEFTDPSGSPAKLPLRGRTRSFAALVRHVRPTLDPSEALAIMMRLKAISRVGTRSVIAKCRVLSTASSRTLTAARMLSVVDAVLTTVERNLGISSRDHKTQKFYERAATNHQVDVRYLHKFQEFLLEQGDDFLQTVDDWLSAHSVRQSNTSVATKTCRVGTGVYMFASE
jgi:hypothetical protein